MDEKAKIDYPVKPRQWKDRISRAQKRQKQIREDAVRYIQKYRGTSMATQGRKANTQAMQVNFPYSYIEQAKAQIFRGNPRVVVEPKPRLMPPELMNQIKMNAQALEGSIDYWFQEKNAAEEFDYALFDSFFSYAAVEVGWEYLEHTEIIKKEMAQMPDGQMVDFSQVDPNLKQYAQKVIKEEEVRTVIRDEPFIRRRKPFEVKLDPDCERIADARFMIVTDTITHNQFMKIPYIPEDLKQKIKPTKKPVTYSTEDYPYQDIERNNQPSDNEWVVLHTIWDKEHMKKVLMAENYDFYLCVEEWPYNLEYKNDPFPITILPGKKDPENPYGFSEFKPIEKHMAEQDRIRTAMLYHMKRSLPKLMAKKGANTTRQVQKLVSAQSDECVEMDAPEAVIAAPQVPLPIELYKWNEIIQNDLTNVSAQTEFNQQQLADTATEASIMEGRSTARKARRSREFEQFVATVGAKLGMILQQYQQDKLTVEINGPGGARSIREVSPEQIQGEFAYSIEPGIMEFKNEEVRKFQFLKWYQLMATNPLVSQERLARIMCKNFDIDADEVLLTPEELQKLQPQPKPELKFAPIKYDEILDPMKREAILQTAMQQNSVAPDLSQLNQAKGLPGMGSQIPDMQPSRGEIGLAQGTETPAEVMGGNLATSGIRNPGSELGI